MPSTDLSYFRQQHKQRLSYMPWLYWSLKDRHQVWAKQWQAEWQDYLCSVETIEIKGDCFIAPEARLFAEPGRPITIGAGTFIAADCVLHGPIHIGQHVALNHHGTIDGGKRGVKIGDHTRIAAYSSLYAFNHLTDPETPVHQQGTRSEGIHIGKDVWVGAHVAITDGVTIGDHAVVGINSTVTRDVAKGQKVAGNPASGIGWRLP